MTAPFTSILFDLDGTIIDSAPGITATLAYTFETMGRPVPSPAELLAYVGPPILDSFRDRAGMTWARPPRRSRSTVRGTSRAARSTRPYSPACRRC